jgi:polar amino acid transport system substrate-binding protein
MKMKNKLQIKTSYLRSALTVVISYLLMSSHWYSNTQESDLVFVTEHLPPFQIEQNNEVKGYTTEIIKKALSHTDLSPIFKVYPWSRSYQIAQERKNTCIYAIARTPQREALFKWIDVITTTNSHFIGLKENNNINI